MPGSGCGGANHQPVTAEEPALIAAIQTHHLTKIYGNRFIAVNDMTVTVPAGSIFGLLGPNGAGKTTTLKILVGLQRPTAGSASVFGHRCGPHAVEVRRKIGYLPTNPKLPGHLTPLEYLDLVGQLCGLSREERKPRLASLLRAVGLLGATSQKIRAFSTGMVTRLGIAASLVASPPLLLWDEPTAGLDPAARRFTLDLVRELGKTRTIVLATHILSDIDQICDHVGVMHEGRMIYCGPMRDLKRRLRRDTFRLELEASAGEWSQVTSALAALEGVEAAPEGGHALTVRLSENASRAGRLAEVLRAIDQCGAKLQTIHSAQNETEDAYLQLLEEDATHGFQRFDLRGAGADGARRGDPPA